jgi:uncharacterized repeat protein (TIGR03803 family)
MALALAIFATQLAKAQTYGLLHGFAGGADGATPSAALVLDAAGNLYGTTLEGGASNLGTVFKVDTTGKETVLYTFTGGDDAARPAGPLIFDRAGNLYGTTVLGGASNLGTVFKLDTSGKETVLYSFAGGADGASPSGPLALDGSGNLYGTTSYGGPSDGGTVFKLDGTGTETVLYTFMGSQDPAGENPSGVVRDAAGNLYGTTTAGGGLPFACRPIGCGAAFMLDTAGKMKVLYVFTGEDSAGPSDLVLDATGNLYGASYSGDVSNRGGVFKLDPLTGKLTILYTFTGGNDGGSPNDVIFDRAGNLYGTTLLGGASNLGTVFKLDTSGKETVLYSFAGGTDGKAARAGLVLDTAGNLYGTTAYGGALNFGTVFKLTPDFSLSASTLTPSPVSPGESSTSTVNVNWLGVFGGPVALSCSVQPLPVLAPKCSISPSSIVPGIPATLTVSTTGATASTLPSTFRPAPPFYALSLPLVGVLASLGLGSKQKRKGKILARAMACGLFVGVVFEIACGGGASGSQGGNNGTPAGKYTITVMGTSRAATGSLMRSAKATLLVQ